MQLTQKKMIIPGIALGILILVLSIVNKPSPELTESYDRARLVSVVELTKQSAAPQISGFGRIAPKHIWQALSEVNGVVVFRHPQLEPGRFLEAGTLVLKIDPLEYELQVAQAEANLNSSKAQLTRVKQEQVNLTSSLKIEQQKLKLSEQEYQRKASLRKQGLISSSELEKENQAVLAQRKLVQDQNSALRLLPDDIKVNQAQITVNQARLDDARRQLEKTDFVLPFDARIAGVNAELQQAVSKGNTLFEAHQLGQVEVKAEMSLKNMRTLVSSIPDLPSQRELPSIENLPFKAEIILQAGGQSHRWPAKVTRVSENVNPDQASIGVYLETSQDFRTMDLISRPPLTKDMFVEAQIQGFESQHFIVEESALHQNQLYLMDADDRLRIVPVEILFRSAKGVAVDGDIKEGDRLVLNDLVPAVPQMALKVQQQKGS